MATHPAAAFGLTCIMMTFLLQPGFAQSPPPSEQSLPIWSDRDLSLRYEDVGSSTETETSLHLPLIESPNGFSSRPNPDVLVCEPGQFQLAEPVFSAFAQARKQQ